MPRLPIITSSDDRRARGVVVQRLRNVLLEPLPAEAGKARFAAISRPGRRRVATLPGAVRGLFSRQGVQGGALFAAAGGALVRLDEALQATTLGALGGVDVAGFDGLRSKLIVRAGGQLLQYDSPTLTTVTNINAPTAVRTMAVAGQRVVAGGGVEDVFGWSRAGDALDWDENGQAADFAQPDPLIAQMESRGDLLNFNAESIQPWRATGGIESEAFAPLLSSVVETGILNRDCLVDMDEAGAMFLGDDLAPYRWRGGLSSVPNRDLTLALQRLRPAQRQLTLGWRYEDGERDVYIVRLQGSERAYAYDLLTGSWSEWASYGRTQYDLAFGAKAFERTFAAAPDSQELYELSNDVFDDEGAPIERVMTVRVLPGRDAPIDELALDIKVLDHPLGGQGTAPKALVAASYDGGFTFDDARTVDLPRAGRYGPSERDSLWGFGQVSREDGLVLEISITEPVRFALYGVLVNPTAEEALT